ERPHRLLHRSYCSRRRGERVEETVARVIDLVARVGAERMPQGPAVVAQRLLESLGAELVEQCRRALDVREHERHRSGGLHGHGNMIPRAQLPDKATPHTWRV